MKRTGYIRRMDDLGRVVIPMEICKKMGISRKSSLDITISDDGNIIMTPVSEKDTIARLIDNLEIKLNNLEDKDLQKCLNPLIQKMQSCVKKERK